MYKTKLCAMLVQNEKTVPDILDRWDAIKHIDVDCWGFKDVGLPMEDLRTLCQNMKATGKKVTMEIMTETKEEWINSAHFAVEAGVDDCMGGKFDKDVMKILHDGGLTYYPFIGRIEGYPHMLHGTVEEIVGLAKEAVEGGADGICLPIYRFLGDIDELTAALLKEIKLPIVSAGTINSKERIIESIHNGIAQLNIGSSYFSGDFAKGGDLAENIQNTVDWMKEA